MTIGTLTSDEATRIGRAMDDLDSAIGNVTRYSRELDDRGDLGIRYQQYLERNGTALRIASDSGNSAEVRRILEEFPVGVTLLHGREIVNDLIDAQVTLVDARHAAREALRSEGFSEAGLDSIDDLIAGDNTVMSAEDIALMSNIDRLRGTTGQSIASGITPPQSSERAVGGQAPSDAQIAAGQPVNPEDVEEVNQVAVAGTGAGPEVEEQNRLSELRRIAEINAQWGLTTAEAIATADVDETTDMYNEASGRIESDEIDMAAVQQALIDNNISVGPDGADGILGPNTLAGLQQYAEQRGIDIDTPEQRLALLRDISENGISAPGTEVEREGEPVREGAQTEEPVREDAQTQEPEVTRRPVQGSGFINRGDDDVLSRDEIRVALQNPDLAARLIAAANNAANLSEMDMNSAERANIPAFISEGGYYVGPTGAALSEQEVLAGLESVLNGPYAGEALVGQNLLSTPGWTYSGMGENQGFFGTDHNGDNVSVEERIAWMGGVLDGRTVRARDGEELTSTELGTAFVTLVQDMRAIGITIDQSVAADGVTLGELNTAIASALDQNAEATRGR
jgi:hypothetical protein